MTERRSQSPSSKAIRFYTAPLSMFGMKVEIALLEKALPFERIEVAYTAVDGYNPKHPDVARVNPKRQVPVLIHGDLELFDSTQILEYIEDIAPEPRLWPATPQARARARQLEHKSDEVYFPHIIKLMGLQDRLSDSFALAANHAALAYYQEMEQQLAGHSYLAGDYSYADIAFYMAQVFGERLGAPMTSATPRLMHWRKRVGERPPVTATMRRLAGYLKQNARPVPSHLKHLLAPA